MIKNRKIVFCNHNKNVIVFWVIFLLPILFGCKSSPSYMPEDTQTIQQQLSTDDPGQSLPDKKYIFNTPIGFGIYDALGVELFNKYAGQQDIIAFRSQYISYLKEVEIGQKMLVLSPGDEPIENFQNLIAEVTPYGVTSLGYNLETALSDSELINKEKDVANLARNANLLYVFGPTLGKLLKNYNDFAQYSDVILLQVQRFQARDNFETKVEDLIGKIKSSNPKVQVWVQVSVNPPDNRNISSEVVIQQIMTISDKADLIWIYYTPRKLPELEEVLNGIRQPKTTQSATQSQQSNPITSTPLTGHLCGYWTFSRPSDLPLPELSAYTNVVFVH